MELPMAPKGPETPKADHHHGPANGHQRPHDHGHHHHSSTQDYEQLLGISVTGILGIASLYLYFSDRLLLILAQKFHLFVLVSGIGLLVLASIRTWLVLSGNKEACCSHDHGDQNHGHSHPKQGCCNIEGHQHHDEGHHSHEEGKCESGGCGVPDHNHDHQHGHEHSHGHAHSHTHAQSDAHSHVHSHGHDHGHDHSHGSGFLPLQTMILLSPIVLLLGLPGEVFNSAQAINAADVEASSRDIGDKGEDFQVTFLQLERAAAHQETRNFYEGKTIRLTGRFVGDDDKRFTLIRYKINCCAADAVPLNSIIMVDPKYPERLPLQKLKGQWVEVTGKVQFLKKVGKEEYVSSLILRPEEGKNLDSIIKIVPQDANPYVN